jgi:manganese transport protein
MNPALATQLPVEAVERQQISGGMLPSGRVRLLRLIGPAFVAAVAFIDPGNVATNVSAGADYGYLLLWAVVSASVMATLVQYLSAKLGAATGVSLAAVCRAHFGTPVRIGLWLVAEVVVIMTDLAEFVGGAVALHLLFGISPLSGGLIIAAATMLILRLRLRGRDVFPIVVIALLFTVTVAFGYLMVRSPFDPQGAASRAPCSPAASSVRPSCRTRSSCTRRWWAACATARSLYELQPCCAFCAGTSSWP